VVSFTTRFILLCGKFWKTVFMLELQPDDKLACSKRTEGDSAQLARLLSTMLMNLFNDAFSSA
jgi:hypothetical protein